jgi:hypothetical protein
LTSRPSASISANHLNRATPRLLDHGDVEIALLVRLHLCFADRLQPGGFQKAGNGVVRRADARAFLLFAHVPLPRRHAMHGQRQPPRRHERPGAFVDQSRIDQPVGHKLAQILRRPRLHARGNFLGEQLEQEVGHWRCCVQKWRGRVYSMWSIVSFAN